MSPGPQRRKDRGCTLCGAELRPGAQYCPGCGETLHRIARSEPPAKISRQSGTRCRACGDAVVKDHARFCTGCGATLEPGQESARSVSATARTAMRIPAEDPVYATLDALLADPRGGAVWLFERSDTELIQRARRRLEGDGVLVHEVASHPSRARVDGHELRALASQLSDRAVETLDRALAARDPEAVIEALVTALVTESVDRPPVVIVDRAHRTTAGTLTRLLDVAAFGALRLVLRAPHPPPAGVEGRVTPLAHPRANEAAPSFEGALDALPRAAADVLEACAVLGWEAPLPAVAHAVGPLFEIGLDALRAHGIVTVGRDRVAFVDRDLADRVLESARPGSVSRWAEAALAWAAEHDAPASVRAEYAGRVADLPTALLALDVAGRRAVAEGAHDVAVEAFTRGLDRVRRAETGDEDVALARSGARLARQLAEVLLLQGDHRSAEGVLREAMERPRLERAERAALTLVVAGVALARHRHDEARRALHAAVALAERADRPEIVADAGLFLALVDAGAGTPPEDVAAMAEASLFSLGDARPSPQLPRLLRRVVAQLEAAGHGDETRAMLTRVVVAVPTLRAAVDALG